MLVCATSLAACGARTATTGSTEPSPRAAGSEAQVRQTTAPDAGTADGPRHVDTAPTPDPGAAPTASAASPSATAGHGPRIIALTETPNIVHAGDSIAFHVRTSADVASVTGTVSAYTLAFTRTSPGRFELAFAIPANVPGFFHGTYAMNVTARGAGGASDSRSVAITFQ